MSNQSFHHHFYRYDSTTGIFTVPPGGDGLYYFSTYFSVVYYEFARFDIRINGETICTAYGATNSSTFPDPDHASCSRAALADEGKSESICSIM